MKNNFLTNFLSNKYNLYGLLAVAYTILITILIQYLNTQQSIIVIIILISSNLIWYTIGVGRGLFLSSTYKAEGWDRLIDKIKNMKDEE